MVGDLIKHAYVIKPILKTRLRCLESFGVGARIHLMGGGTLLTLETEAPVSGLIWTLP